MRNYGFTLCIATMTGLQTIVKGDEKWCSQTTGTRNGNGQLREIRLSLKLNWISVLKIPWFVFCGTRGILYVGERLKGIRRWIRICILSSRIDLTGVSDREEPIDKAKSSICTTMPDYGKWRSLNSSCKNCYSKRYLPLSPDLALTNDSFNLGGDLF